MTIIKENFENPQKWALIARKIKHRNQHQVKNRFISIVCKEMGYKKCEIKRIFEGFEFNHLLGLVLEKLTQKEEIYIKETYERDFQSFYLDSENEGIFFIFVLSYRKVVEFASSDENANELKLFLTQSSE